MTTRERIYEFIVSYTKENLYQPSIREIGDGVGLKSTSSVYTHLQRLENDGFIKISHCGEPRAITLVGYELRRKEE